MSLGDVIWALPGPTSFSSDPAGYHQALASLQTVHHKFFSDATRHETSPSPHTVTRHLSTLIPPIDTTVVDSTPSTYYQATGVDDTDSLFGNTCLSMRLLFH